MTNSNQLDFHEPTLQQVADLCSQFGFTCAGEADLACLRAVLREGFSRWGHQPAPPVEGEAIGPEWQPCVKLPITVHVREQRSGETQVSTREGITPVRPDDLIMRGVQGYLAHKWSLTASLPSDHPYKSTAPTIGALCYDIEVQLQRQGFTLGDRAPLFQRWSTEISSLRIHGLLTEAESDRAWKRLWKDLTATAKPLPAGEV